MSTPGQANIQPVVFVGPSASREDIKAVLPDAFMAPPIQRGDLYKYRLLNFSVFVIIDGIFVNALAVSPREVVDTLRDGAAVIGASSMGALRAADCAPAGALGYGRIYRLFRRRVLSSEDEVAVATFPEPPHAPLSRALVDIRFALRLGCRSNVLSKDAAERLLQAALDTPYPDRTWKRLARGAGIDLSAGQVQTLEQRSVKRTDAIGCCRWVAAQLHGGHFAATPRKDRTAQLGALFSERERTSTPLDGADQDGIREAFFDWLWASGKGQLLIGQERFLQIRDSADIAAQFAEFNLLEPGDELAALLMQFAGHRRSAAAARDRGLQAGLKDTERVRKDLPLAHRENDWEALLARHETQASLRAVLEGHLAERAAALAFARNVLFPSPGRLATPVPIWRRTATADQF